ncbi:MAG: tetratricopeptide repeat protein [Nitrospinaceae bacterium]
MARVYLSFHENYLPAWTDKIRSRLQTAFGGDNVISHRETTVLKNLVAGCDALVALSGPEGFGPPAGPGDAATSTPQDRVRREIECGRQHGLLMVPVLLPGAVFPKAGNPLLASPSGGPPCRVQEETWVQDIAALVHRLETGLALQTLARNALPKRGSIQQRDLPEEDLLGFTAANRPADDLGLSHSNLHETRRAIDFQTTALELARRQKDVRTEAQALGRLALAYGKLGEVRSAIECFERQLRIVRDLGDLAGAGEILANLGDACAVRGDLNRAQGFYKDQLAAALQTENRNLEAAALVGLGHCHIKAGQVEQGVTYYDRAHHHIRETGDLAEQARLLVALGLNCRKLGRTREAIEYLKQALELARRLGDRREEGNLLADLAEAYQELGEPSLVVGFCEQRLEVVRDLKDAVLEGKTMLELARAWHDRGQTQRAREIAHAACNRVRSCDSGLTRTIEEQLSRWSHTGETDSPPTAG